MLDKRIVLKSPYFFTGVIILIILTLFSIYKSNKVGKEAELKNISLVHNFSINSIATFEDIILDYLSKLEDIRDLLVLNPENSDKILELYISKDSSLRDIRIESTNNCYIEENQIKPDFPSNTLRFIIPSPQSSKAIILDLDLLDLHSRVAESKKLTYAYLTVSYCGRYIYHPDEKRLGQFSAKQLSRVGSTSQGTTSQGTTSQDSIPIQQQRVVLESYSDYLEIPIYKYIDQIYFGNNSLTNTQEHQPWTFSANVPAISFKDIVINTRNAFLAISLLATIAFALIFSWGMMRWQKELFRSEQQKQLVLEKELEQLKSGLNPHFLFNSLSSLKILVSKKPEEAKSFAVALSKLYRYLLMQERLDLISLNEELEFTQNYIYLQQIRFSNFRVNIFFNSTSASKDSTATTNKMSSKKLPPMSLQLLVENSIKHTKMSSSDPLVVDIDIQDKYIVVKNNYNPPESSIKSFADKDFTSSFDNKDLSDYTPNQRNNNVSGKGIANLTKRYSYLTDKQCRFYIKEGCFFAEIPLI